jgi:hypothetical protein
VKPRLDNLPVTVEDVAVQVDVVARCGRILDGSMFGYWVMRRATESDRRDADLMFCWLAAPENSPRYWSLYYLSGRHLE